jgi:hypothetical protein
VLEFVPGDSPFHRLPFEILIHIFRLNTDVEFPDDDPSFAFVASQVCSRWRTVLISAPELWEYIPLRDSAARTDAALRRSGGIPIVAKMRKVSDECLDLIEEHFYRISTLHIELDNYLHSLRHPRLKEIIQANPAPSLTWLKLQGPVSRTVLPPHLFTGEVPFNLVHLEIVNCVFPSTTWNKTVPPKLATLVLNNSVLPRPRGAPWLLCGTLTALKVVDCRYIWNSTEAFVNCISCLPLLELVSIHNSLQYPIPTTSHHSRFSLPRMRHLTLEEDAITIFLLLGRWDLPKDVSLDLGFESPPVSNDIEALSALISSHFTVQFSQLHVDYRNSNQGGHMRCDGFTFCATSPPGAPIPSTYLRVSCCYTRFLQSDPPMTIEVHSLLQMLLALPTAANAHDVLLSYGNIPHDGDEWLSLLAPLQHALNVHLIGPAVSSFIGAIEVPKAAELFPRMSKLTLHDHGASSALLDSLAIHDWIQFRDQAGFEPLAVLEFIDDQAEDDAEERLGVMFDSRTKVVRRSTGEYYRMAF